MNRYSVIRPSMRPGDLIAFSGKGRVSHWIKLLTRGQVSHVGIVLRRSIVGSDHEFVEVIESTSLGGTSGVQVNRLSDRVNHYDGALWWMPLHSTAREIFEEAAFFDFLFNQVGKEYDTGQALAAGFDLLDRLGLGAEQDFEKFFCSELCVAGLQAAGVLGEGVNASEVTPIELVRWPLWGPSEQIAGEPEPLRL